MKKIYLQPEAEVVDLKFNQTLLAGSPSIPIVEGESVDDPGVLPAPGMDLPGMPSIPGVTSEFPF